MRDSLSRIILTHISCLLTGFALAAWTLPQIRDGTPRNASTSDKPRFSVTIPVNVLDQINAVLPLRGKNVRLVRRDNEALCVLDHAPLRLELLERSVNLSGPLSSLESFYLHVLPQDLHHLQISEFGGASPMPSCRMTPKITYGD
jgi:hypothetical protein